MGFFDRISSGLHRSRDKFKEQMNILLDRGPDVDEEFCGARSLGGEDRRSIHRD